MHSFQTCSQYGQIPLHVREKKIKTSGVVASTEAKTVYVEKKLAESHKKVLARDDHIVLVAQHSSADDQLQDTFQSIKMQTLQSQPTE